MNVKVEKVEKNKVKLEIEVDAQKFEEAMQKSFQKNVNKYTVQGFRKGKTPRKIFERYYGEGVLYEDAFNIAGADAYDKAIEDNNIFAIDRPEIDIVEIGSGKNLVFTAEVTVKPEIEIKKYKGIEVKKVEYNVTDADINQELEKMREKNARLVAIEDRDLQDGDIAMIDYEGSIDGVPFEGGSATNYELEIGKGTFINGFEEQLVGMKLNEEKEIKVTFPEEYHSKEVAGKDATFKVFLHSMKAKELPEIDDEFAKDVSEFDTLELLKEDIKTKLSDANEQKAKKEIEDDLLEKIIENSEVEIPRIMIEKQIDAIVRDFDWRMRMQGMNLENYLQFTNTNYNEFRAKFSEGAEKSVKIQLALEKISKDEKIEVTDEDLNSRISEIAKGYSQEAEDFKKSLKDEDIDYLKDELKTNNTIKFLMEEAVIS